VALQINIDNLNEDILYIKLVGEVNTDNDNDFIEQFNSIFDKVRENVILDLAMCSYLNSKAIGTITYLHRLLQSNQKKLIILNPTGIVESIFKVTRLINMLIIKSSLEEAVSICSPQGKNSL